MDSGSSQLLHRQPVGEGLHGPQRDALGQLRRLPDSRGGQMCLGCTLETGGLRVRTHPCTPHLGCTLGTGGLQRVRTPPCTPHLGKTAAPPELLGLNVC